MENITAGTCWKDGEAMEEEIRLGPDTKYQQRVPLTPTSEENERAITTENIFMKGPNATSEDTGGDKEWATGISASELDISTIRKGHLPRTGMEERRQVSTRIEEEKYDRMVKAKDPPRIRKIQKINPKISTRILRNKTIRVDPEIISLEETSDSSGAVNKKERRTEQPVKKRKRNIQSSDDSWKQERTALLQRLEEAKDRIEELEAESAGKDNIGYRESFGSKSAKPLPSVEEIRSTLRLEPVFALESEMIENINKIEHVASRSTRLKGTMKRQGN